MIGFEPDISNSLKSLTPPGKDPHIFKYNPDGQMTRMTPPALSGQSGTSSLAAGEVAYRYNAKGQLEGMDRSDGRSVGYGYDSMGRLKSESFGVGRRVTYDYDLAGRAYTTSTAPWDTKVTDTFDGGLWIGSNWTGSQVTGSVQASYDADFRLEVLKINGGTPVSYTSGARQLDPPPTSRVTRAQGLPTALR